MGCCCDKCHSCRPRCDRRCVGTYTTQYRVYENRCYSVYKVCGCCGYEYDHQRYHACPRCGAVMDDPPRFGGFRFGGFGGFGRRFRGFERERFPRFGGFFPREREENIF